MADSLAGVSVILPVYNGEATLARSLEALLAEDDGRPFELLAVDDRSDDRSPEILAAFAADSRIERLEGPGQGAAAAINLALARARHPIVLQVDQDVVVEPGWLRALVAALADRGVAAAQGVFVVDRDDPLIRRLSGYDLALRHARLAGVSTDHVCTGTTAYQAAALAAVGGFDEGLGYGYDNDLSYRLVALGHRLVVCPKARCRHLRPATVGAYLVQQYGLGYGRLELIRRHPRRFLGDRVSGPTMLLHAPLTLLAVAAIFVAPLLAVVRLPWRAPMLAGAALLIVLAGERCLAGVRAARRFSDHAAVLLAPLHLGRNLAWCWAIVRWSGRRLFGRDSRPAHSMVRRSGPRTG